LKIREIFNKIGEKVKNGYDLFVRFRYFFEETVIKHYSLCWEEEIHNPNTVILFHDVSAIILQRLAMRYAQDPDDAEDKAYQCATSIIEIMRDVLREGFGEDLDVEEIEIISNRAALIKAGFIPLVEGSEGDGEFVHLSEKCPRVRREVVKSFERP